MRNAQGKRREEGEGGVGTHGNRSVRERESRYIYLSLSLSPGDLVVVLGIGLPRHVPQSFQPLEFLTDPCEISREFRRVGDDFFSPFSLFAESRNVEKNPESSTSSCFRYDLARSLRHGIHDPRMRAGTFSRVSGAQIIRERLVATLVACSQTKRCNKTFAP